jgi:signal transduction histidine kinase
VSLDGSTINGIKRRLNTTRFTFGRIGPRGFSLILGGVLVLIISGLVIIDQALERTNRATAEIDARESSSLIRERIDELQSWLETLGLLFAASTPADRITSFSIIAQTLSRKTPALQRVWVADTTGHTVFDTVVVVSSTPEGYNEPGTTTAPTYGWRSATREIAIQGYGRGRYQLLIGVPLASSGHTVGVAWGAFDPGRLFAVLSDDWPVKRRSWVLRAGHDTLAAAVRPEVGSAGERVTSQVRGTDREPWLLDIAYSSGAQRLRLTLWVLGLSLVAFLSVGVIRERRQGIRISERSAELERLSTELLRANRMKSEFLANVSHELRTPLNAIVGFVDLLRDGVYGELAPRQAPPVERIAASATHLRHLVDQVLDIAKIAAGRLEVHAEMIVLRPFVLNVTNELESLISEQGLNLVVAVGPSLPRIRTDPTHLRQILVNLIGNSVKYTLEGHITVRARLVGTEARIDGHRAPAEDPTFISRSPDVSRIWIALQVIDTGIGIAPADQERIFDEFEQVNAGPRGESMQRGTGLGLAISRRLVRLLGGEITVESQLGKGSTFTIWLPVNAGDLQASALDASEGERSRQPAV